MSLLLLLRNEAFSTPVAVLFTPVDASTTEPGRVMACIASSRVEASITHDEDESGVASTPSVEGSITATKTEGDRN